VRSGRLAGKGEGAEQACENSPPRTWEASFEVTICNIKLEVRTGD
jgi:hypothetical protein